MIAFWAAFACMGATPAWAVLVHLKSGRWLSYEALSGSRAPGSLRNFDQAYTNLDYSGGPVMASNTNFVIEWKPSNYSGTAFQTGYVTGFGTFFGDLAHDSGLTTNSDAVSAQYNDVNGNLAAYDSHYGGTYVDTDPLPSNGCSDATICLTDAQLQSELDSFLSSQHLPSDLTHEYYLLTPPDVASCFDASSGACSANSSSPYFCAYHSQTSGGYVYSNIPDLDGIDGCDPYYTYCPSAACDYPNGPADGMLTAVAHEHNESITDPQPNNAWTDWGSSVGGEIGDKCATGQIASDPNNVDNPQPDGNDAPYNQVINGHDYWLQPEWSNQTMSCLDGLAPNGTTVTAGFSVSSGGGDTENFDASVSTASGSGISAPSEYVWQFNDGPGQTNTQETTSPTISHTFASSGAYQVALTVMASDGTSYGTAATVEVGSSTSTPSNTAPPAISGTAQQGDTLTEGGDTWTNSPDSYVYQWEDCDASGANCAAIPGATAQTYVLGAADVGDTIRVTVTATNGGGSSTPAWSAATGTVTTLAPVNSAPPTVSGTATQGQTLTEAHGTWSNGPTSYSYQWEDCNSAGAACSPIAGATSQTYTLATSDVGSTIVVEETATNGNGSSAPAASAPTAVVLPLPPSNGSLPTIRGTAQQGQTLTVSEATWTNNPTQVSDQWEECDSSGNNCAKITGATGGTYVPTAGEVGNTLRVHETATNAGGSGSADSAPTAVVLPAAPSDASPPTISGSAVEGQTLTGADGSWSNAPASYSVQWEDCDSAGSNCSPVAGATLSVYTVGAGDVGHTIRFLVTAANAGGSGSAASAPTSVVIAPASSGSGGSGSGGSGSTATVASASVGSPRLSGQTVSETVSCAGAGECSVKLTLAVVETLRGRKLIAVTARKRKVRLVKKVVVLGTATVTLAAGQSRVVRVSLNPVGRRLLGARHTLHVELSAVSAGKTISRRTLAFKAPGPKHKKKK